MERLTDGQRALIEANAHLPKAVAAWFYRDRRKAEDRAADGTLGLIRAAVAYDPAQGEFARLAWPCIANELRRAHGRDAPRAAVVVGGEAGYAMADQAPGRDGEPGPADDLELARELVREALDDLEGRRAEVMRAYFGGGLDMVQIGRKHGVSKAAVHAMVKRTLRRLAGDPRILKARELTAP